MEKPPRNRMRDAVVVTGIALVLAVVVSVSAREQERGVHVPDLTGRAVYQTTTLLEVRGLTPGEVYTGRCPSLARPKTVLSQVPEPGTLVRPGAEIDLTTCGMELQIGMSPARIAAIQSSWPSTQESN
jgi:beta-lactam-binding protein with PASTA domain